MDHGGRALLSLGAHLGLPKFDKLRMPDMYEWESDDE